ncbi:hypothetical protein BDA96_08G186400 [Sorghum bicolor]|uniref:Uncharacterized protein n=1 Tax=Sorghum bicolor TaxID=4558 RepID=A0A921QHA8_SORBI|nr:hypothetical protein BDA96_08G186400 [Sorghum bicolor]
MYHLSTYAAKWRLRSTTQWCSTRCVDSMRAHAPSSMRRARLPCGFGRKRCERNWCMFTSNCCGQDNSNWLISFSNQTHKFMPNKF